MTTDGQATREKLEATIAAKQDRIQTFNAHWLNHKNIFTAAAVLIMALIFTGMLIKAIELALWALCGILVVALIGVMIWRGKMADKLNDEMAEAQQAFKDYERGRRKKK